MHDRWTLAIAQRVNQVDDSQTLVHNGLVGDHGATKEPPPLSVIDGIGRTLKRPVAERSEFGGSGLRGIVGHRQQTVQAAGILLKYRIEESRGR